MSHDEMFVTLIYILFVICVLYPPIEVVSAGFTIPSIFSWVLGNEIEQFTQYHIRRTCLTLLIYSFLPIGYISVIECFGNEDGIGAIWWADNIISRVLLTLAAVLPLAAWYQIESYGNDWERHPLVVNLRKFCNNNSNWMSIASDINTEFRSYDKFCVQTNTVSKIIATDNWVIKINPLSVFVSHQSDSNLIVKESDTHQFSTTTSGETQYITIEVMSSRVPTFKIRLNALDFKDLQDKITRTITVLPEIKFHKNVIDRFIDAFKEAVKQNVTYLPTQELDQCMGCMQNLSNVKLQKLCETTESNNCTTCYCKPMWCVDCLGRWFAHRQDATKVETWMSSKCTCPMCRAQFCLLDVCLINVE